MGDDRQERDPKVHIHSCLSRRRAYHRPYMGGFSSFFLWHRPSVRPPVLQRPCSPAPLPLIPRPSAEAGEGEELAFDH